MDKCKIFIMSNKTWVDFELSPGEEAHAVAYSENKTVVKTTKGLFTIDRKGRKYDLQITQ